MPSVAEIQVVGWDDALIEARSQRRIQRQTRTAARVHDLRLADYAQDLSIEVVPVCDLRSGQIRRLVCKVNARPVRDLVDQGRVDADAVVIALVIVEVALVRTAELKQVIAMEPRQVVAQQPILPVPETAAGILRIHVVWNQSIYC